jgi:pimeloyl-ACP methyl ester carboxylesterase
MRAVPLFMRPSAPRLRAFLNWETEGARLDPGWLELAALGATLRPSRIVLPRRPDPGRLRTLTVPVLLLLAERSKAHDIQRVGDTASRLLPYLSTAVLPGATHHTIPTEDADRLQEPLLAFLTAEASDE